MSPITNQISGMLSNIEFKIPKLQLPNMSTVVKITPIAVAIFAAANAPTAEGGPILEAVCYAGCWGLVAANPALVGWLPICIDVCTATGFLPTP